MNKQKMLLILSLILNLLLILTVSFVVIVYFNFWGLGDKLGISINNNEENIVSEEENIEEGTTQEEGDVEDLVDEYADWNTYTNEEMGFEFRYPVVTIVEGENINLVVMERLIDELGVVNCINIGPVEGDNVGSISIGYDPVEGYPNNCFRSGVGAGEQTEEDVELLIGNQLIDGRKLIYIGEEGEQSYTNYSFHLDNPNMSDDEYNYFGVQIEYYTEYENLYLNLYEEILKTFEWL
ncbi:MAG: hypothetical protein PHP08_02745 [Candidatus Dojkabacteria bacterium]|nr:hypothetical protein [Candidatus Dojkabacteria bacterium]